MIDLGLSELFGLFFLLGSGGGIKEFFHDLILLGGEWFAEILFDEDADGFAICSTNEAEGVFAIGHVDEVAFAKGATSDKLDGVYGAVVGFYDGNDLFVTGALAHFLNGFFGNTDANGEAGAHVTVKFLNRFDVADHMRFLYLVLNF